LFRPFQIAPPFFNTPKWGTDGAVLRGFPFSTENFFISWNFVGVLLNFSPLLLAWYHPASLPHGAGKISFGAVVPGQ
jgi:hypothetical protein